VNTSLEQLVSWTDSSSDRVMWIFTVCRLLEFFCVIIFFVLATGHQVTDVIVVSRPRPIPPLYNFVNSLVPVTRAHRDSRDDATVELLRR